MHLPAGARPRWDDGEADEDDRAARGRIIEPDRRARRGRARPARRARRPTGERGGDRRLDARDAARRGRVGGRRGPAAQARRRGVSRRRTGTSCRRSRCCGAAPGLPRPRGRARRRAHALVRASSPTAPGGSARRCAALGVGAERARRDALAQPARAARGALRRARRAAARCARSTRASPRPRCASSSSTAARRCCCSTPSSRPRGQAPSSCPGCASCGSATEYEELLESAGGDAARLARRARIGRSPSTTRAARRARPRASSTRTAAPTSARSPSLVETRSAPDSSYLWTLPMFHCNGWCFTWAVPGVGATSVVLPRPEPAAVWRELRAGATHLCAAPTVLITLLGAPRRRAARARR